MNKIIIYENGKVVETTTSVIKKVKLDTKIDSIALNEIIRKKMVGK